MQIVLPPELEELVQRQLASGKYQTAIEVLLTGAKLLDRRQQPQLFTQFKEVGKGCAAYDNKNWLLMDSV